MWPLKSVYDPACVIFITIINKRVSHLALSRPLCEDNLTGLLIFRISFACVLLCSVCSQVPSWHLADVFGSHFSRCLSTGTVHHTLPPCQTTTQTSRFISALCVSSNVFLSCLFLFSFLLFSCPHCITFIFFCTFLSNGNVSGAKVIVLMVARVLLCGGWGHF